MSATDLLEELRRSDPDRHLSVLYAPEAVRPALAALYAFNVEIAAVRDRVSQPLPGEIRLQWWRDLIGSGETGEGAASPLSEALLDAISRYRLPRDAFERMLDARIFDLYDDPMPSVSDLEGYAGETASALIQLASLVIAPDKAPAFATAAGHAGCAQAVAGLLRSLPIHMARGQCFVPLDVLAAAGLDRDRFLARQDKAAVARAISAMVALGREHHAAFVAHARRLPSSLRPAYLPLATVPASLDLVQKAGAGAADAVVAVSPIRRQAAGLRRALTGW